MLPLQPVIGSKPSCGATSLFMRQQPSRATSMLATPSRCTKPLGLIPAGVYASGTLPLPPCTRSRFNKINLFTSEQNMESLQTKVTARSWVWGHKGRERKKKIVADLLALTRLCDTMRTLHVSYPR